MSPSQPDLEDLLRPWVQVATKADDFFAQVFSRHRRSMQCAPGCCDCCQQDLSVLLAEALAILAGLAQVPDEQRRRLSRQAIEKPGCALLVDDRCVVYEARPMICRTHGIPIRHDADRILCCDRNFVDGLPDQSMILNASLLTAGLAVADALVRKRLQMEDPVRISIRRLVTRGWSALPGNLVWSREDQLEFVE